MQHVLKSKSHKKKEKKKEKQMANKRIEKIFKVTGEMQIKTGCRFSPISWLKTVKD